MSVVALVVRFLESSCGGGDSGQVCGMCAVIFLESSVNRRTQQTTKAVKWCELHTASIEDSLTPSPGAAVARKPNINQDSGEAGWGETRD